MTDDDAKDMHRLAVGGPVLTSLERELLAACQAQHQAIDYLMAQLIAKGDGFMPTKSPVWPAVVQGNAAITKAGGQ